MHFASWFMFVVLVIVLFIVGGVTGGLFKRNEYLANAISFAAAFVCESIAVPISFVAEGQSPHQVGVVILVLHAILWLFWTWNMIDTILKVRKGLVKYNP